MDYGLRTKHMSSHSPEEKTPQPGSLQAMLARLRGMVQALKSSEPSQAPQPEFLPAPPPTPQRCPYCQALRKTEHVYCDECGWIFPTVEATPATAPTVPQD